MDFETAKQAWNNITALLNIDRVRRRAIRPRPHVAIGFAPSASGGFQVAIRARSNVDLEKAFGAGIGDEVMELAYHEADVQFTGAIEAAPAAEAPIPSGLRMGASVGHYDCTAGSLGFFAQHEDYSIGFVSNNHVLANCDQGVEGDDILHPGPMDGGTRSANVIASLAGGYPQMGKRGPVPVDAAFARLRDGITYDASSIGGQLQLNSVRAPLLKQLDVIKFGRSTGLTRARISAFALQNLDVDYPSLGRIFFDRQIEIKSDDEDHPFSKPGDSGSLVVNPQGNAVGLLFARSCDGRFTYLNPIDDVLRELNVRLIV